MSRENELIAALQEIRCQKQKISKLILLGNLTKVWHRNVVKTNENFLEVVEKIEDRSAGRQRQKCWRHKKKKKRRNGIKME